MKLSSIAALAAALAATTGAAEASTNLVTNGGFENVRGGVYGHLTVDQLALRGVASLWAPNGGAYTDSAAVGWSVPQSIGYIFAHDGLIDPPAYPDPYYGYYGVSQNYGPSYLRYTNGLGVDPDGGNFIALDGDHYGEAISQTITGLTVGQGYTLNFYQASDHYQGWGDVQTSRIKVNFGSEQQYADSMTPTLSTPVPWKQVTMYFTATSSSQVLSFFNEGIGAPPFALLDGVSLTEGVPEPSAWALMIGGFAMVGGVLRRRRERAAVAAR